jgi:DNA-binding transcriptional LysR family regulator
MQANGIMHATGLIELEAAIAVAKHRNFRAAAAEMGMSPTSISSTIRALEARIGVQLFSRTTRSVALTSAGEAFINRVSSSVADIADAIGAARGQADEPRGLLRINSSVTAGHNILSPLITTCLDRYPAIQVELVTDQRLVDIVLQGFDAGIRMTDSVPGDMIAVPLGFSLDFSVVGSPLYFAQHPEPATPHDLMYHRCIRSRWAGGGIYRWEFQRGGETFNIDVPGALILDEQSLILKAAISGLGVAYLADTFTREAVEAGQLKYVLQDCRAKPAPLSLYYPRNRHTPATLRAFVELIRAQARGRGRSEMGPGADFE